MENLRTKRKNPNRHKQEMTLKPDKISGPFIVTSSIVISLNLPVQLYVPKEETFPIPLKSIDVMRSTHADLGVAQEKRNDDYWNVDENRSSSDSWTGFTKFTVLKETPPKVYLWSGWRLTKIQTTTRPDHVWLETWSRIGKSRSEKTKTRIGN